MPSVVLYRTQPCKVVQQVLKQRCIEWQIGGLQAAWLSQATGRDSRDNQGQEKVEGAVLAHKLDMIRQIDHHHRGASHHDVEPQAIVEQLVVPAQGRRTSEESAQHTGWWLSPG